MPFPPDTPPLRLPSLRLRGPGELVETVPYVLGFHPSDSLVLMSLRRSRLGVCMRVDLPDPAEAREVAGYTVAKLCDDGATAAVLLVYGPSSETPATVRPSRRDLVDACCRLLADAGVQVRDALQVADNRWWSYLCDDTECCPSGGTPLPASGSGVTAAAWAFAGRAALPDRAAVAAAVEPPSGARARAMRRTVRQVQAATHEAGPGRAPDAYERECLAAFREAVQRCEHPRAQVDDDQAARLALALFETAVRDEVVLWAGGPRREALSRLLRDVLARVPSPHDVAAAATYAWVAYQGGNGVLARAALDRALDSDPRYGLAQLLDDAFDAGVHPALLAEVGVRARLDRHRRAASAAGSHDAHAP